MKLNTNLSPKRMVTKVKMSGGGYTPKQRTKDKKRDIGFSGKPVKGRKRKKKKKLGDV